MAHRALKALCKSFTKQTRSFSRNEGGNIAMMTAIGSVMLVGMMAVAIDLTNGINTRINLADATDTVALQLAKSGLETDADLMAAAEAHLAQLYPGREGDTVKVVSLEKDGDTVNLVLANNAQAPFSGIFGRSDIDVSTGASAIYAERQMDISLVLDTTLSMGDPSASGGSKLAAMQTAANEMVTTIEGYRNAQVRMSVVPYSNYVNVGLSRRNAPWLRVDPDSSTTTNECRMVRPVLSRKNCRTVTVNCDKDGVQSTCRRQVCDVTRGPEEEVCGPRTTNRTWNGCVGSRNTPLDVRPEFGGNRIPGLVNAQCGTELQPLTNNLSSVKGTINALSPQGNTYMPSGLAWGWRTLDSRMPLRSTDNGADKVLILMTDGLNSRSKQGEWHEFGRNASDRDAAKRAANAKTTALCNAIKSDDIIVYTIAFEVNDAATRTLLNNCASGGGNFFNARNAEELTKAFRDIGESLNELRIAA